MNIVKKTTAKALLGTLRQTFGFQRILKDGAIVDTALASALNLLSVFVIGAVYGLSALGEFSLVLIYSSFVYLFAYNFIIIPVTSKSWDISDFEFAQKVTTISLIAILPIALVILIFDNYVLNFSGQNVFLSFLYIIANNVFLTLRRVVLHSGIAKYPSLIPLLVLFALLVLAMLNIVSYQTFLLAYSISFLAAVATIVLKRPGRALLPDRLLAGKFLLFSRWMAVGIWFQWLSGNLVQLLVQYHNGLEGLGELRILLSSFGFLSIYFQYQEIVVARAHRLDAQPRFDLSSMMEVRAFVLPGLLIALCFPTYLLYCYAINTPPHVGPALVYAIYQLLVLISITMRVYLRLMKDMRYSSLGYVAMVITIIALDLVYFNAVDITAAAFMYLASISVMVAVLAVGLVRVSDRMG